MQTKQYLEYFFPLMQFWILWFSRVKYQNQSPQEFLQKFDFLGPNSSSQISVYHILNFSLESTSPNQFDCWKLLIEQYLSADKKEEICYQLHHVFEKLNDQFKNEPNDESSENNQAQFQKALNSFKLFQLVYKNPPLNFQIFECNALRGIWKHFKDDVQKQQFIELFKKNPPVQFQFFYLLMMIFDFQSTDIDFLNTPEINQTFFSYFGIFGIFLAYLYIDQLFSSESNSILTFCQSSVNTMKKIWSRHIRIYFSFQRIYSWSMEFCL